MADRVLVGEEVASSKRMTQIYAATHGGDGSRLPYMHRSFISFSFGGRNIEDFGLIAVTNGDRIQRAGSSNFENITTTYDVVNGQMYWGTYFQGNTLSLDLATDGITQRQLDDFLRWFRGGETRELILSEHPNRGIYARVAEPPSLSLLPFENKTSFTVQYDTFSTSTTLYRGEIGLTFQMDEPFWHAIENIFGHWDEEKQIYVDDWIDANGKPINIFDSTRNKDAIKIMLEDGIPFSSMIQDNMLLGNNTVANTSNTQGAIVGEDSFLVACVRVSSDSNSGENENENTNSQAFSVIIYTVEYMKLIVDFDSGTSIIVPKLGAIARHEEVIFNDDLISFPDDDLKRDLALAFDLDVDTMTMEAIKSIINGRISNGYSYTVQWDDPNVRTHVYEDPMTAIRIQGVYMTDSGGIEHLAEGENAINKFYFYYAGTAPAYPILEFSLTPSFEQETGFINSPANAFARTQNVLENYNTLTIESQEQQDFYFTTPNLYTSYNTALQIFHNNIGRTPQDLSEAMQENVKHYLVRAWAMRILDYYKTYRNNQIIADSAETDNFVTLMQYLFKDEDSEIQSANFSFDSKNGTALGTFEVRDCTSQAEIPTTSAGWGTYGSMLTFTENVGDMVKSNWLVIKERNQPDENNRIRAWDNATETSKLYSHRIYHNVENGLQHVKLIYNNMYV